MTAPQQSLLPMTPPATARKATGPMAPFRTVGALILREMGSTYGRNPGGYIWAILEPLGMILLMVVLFQLISRNPPLGTSFLLFFATGLPPFRLFGSVSSAVQSSLRYSRPLLAYPRVNWLDAVIARFVLNVLTDLTVISILWIAILMLTDSHAVLNILPILNGLALVALIGLGVGLVNCVLTGLFPIWATAWGIINRPLMIGSGVLFMYEHFPPAAQSILWWNPLIHAIALVRSGFYATYHPDFVSITYCYGVALVLIAAGLLLMRAWHKTVLEQ